MLVNSLRYDIDYPMLTLFLALVSSVVGNGLLRVLKRYSTAEARHSRALATGTAMPAQEPAFSGSGFSEFADSENSNFQ